MSRVAFFGVQSNAQTMDASSPTRFVRLMMSLQNASQEASRTRDYDSHGIRSSGDRDLARSTYLLVQQAARNQ